MRSRLWKALAGYCRRFGDWLDPIPETVADRLFPRALRLCQDAEGVVRAGSIKHLVVMKQLERETRASRLDINEAIERAVRQIRKGTAA